MRQERKARVQSAQIISGNGETLEKTVALLLRLMGTFLNSANASSGFTAAKDELDADENADTLVGVLANVEIIAAKEAEFLAEIEALEDVPAIEVWEKQRRQWD